MWPRETIWPLESFIAWWTCLVHYIMVTSHYINYDYANDHETSEGRPELCHSCTEMTPKFGINNQILSQKSLKLGL